MQKKKNKEVFKLKEAKYYPQAKVACSCGAKFNVGSTMPEINVEICSNCHPFYTGTQKLVDSSGRVDKFKNRLEKRNKMVNKKTKTK